MELNAYNIKWALHIDENNVFDWNKSFFGANQKSLDKQMVGKKGRFFVITDKQFGLTQNAWKHHLQVTSKSGCLSMIPMTKKQFENPIILNKMQALNSKREKIIVAFQISGGGGNRKKVTYLGEKSIQELVSLRDAMYKNHKKNSKKKVAENSAAFFCPFRNNDAIIA